ncbi:hypothetical protein AAHA92_05117 [Salvia divinorum]|uniref:Uncharacterized protein n=1 Tax=Salvia divinorum TaxID=28513 RepID=A0ABD1I1E4_SALDI
MEVETIIIITSNTVELVCNIHGPLVASLADLDEVNSPYVGGALKARRKLFVEESTTDDRQSLAAAPVFYHGTVLMSISNKLQDDTLVLQIIPSHSRRNITYTRRVISGSPLKRSINLGS